LWAAHAGSLALLLKPAALGADQAWRQAVGYRGQYLDNAGRQLAVGTVEVAAFVLFAVGGKAKYLCRL